MPRAIAPTPSQLAFAYYSAPKDTSGVTTWLEEFIKQWDHHQQPVAMQLFQLGWQPQGSSLSRSVSSQPLRLHSRAHPMTTQQGVRDHLQFLNWVCPKIFIPQCLIDAHFAAKYASQFGLKWVFTLHSDDPVYWALADHCGPSREQGTWVAVSEHIAKIARKKFPLANIEVIPCGVDIPEPVTTWNPERFRVAYSGRLIEHQKCISKVIDTLVQFCQQVPHADAVVMGYGDIIDALKSKVQAAGLSARISFLGHLTAEQVHDQLLQSQAILLQSEFEGLPVSLMEGMARGVVPVARHIPSGIPELIDHESTGLLANEEGSDAVAQLIRLAEDREFWQKLSQNARQRVEEQFSKSQCFSKWHRVLAELSPRSNPTWPIPIPKVIELPAVDDRMKHFDARKATLRSFSKFWIKQSYISAKSWLKDLRGLC